MHTLLIGSVIKCLTFHAEFYSFGLKRRPPEGTCFTMFPALHDYLIAVCNTNPFSLLCNQRHSEKPLLLHLPTEIVTASYISKMTFK
jgi:hypothetical protein